MSSYVTSPFVLEDRRLQGIVQQCTSDLNLAIKNIIDQQKLYEEQRKAQEEKDAQYFSELSKEELLFERKENSKREDVQQRKKRLRLMLEDIQIELEEFQKNYGELDSATKRQTNLIYILESAEQDLEIVEQKIKNHISCSEKEMLSKVSTQTLFSLKKEVAVLKIKRGNKGVSLKEVENTETVIQKQSTPLTIFLAKMEQALSSPYAERISQLNSMKKQLDSQPDYAKNAFAVKNMKQLDDLIKRLDGIGKQDQSFEKKREKLVCQYMAICKLLEIQPDISLLNDKRNSLRLSQEYKELVRIFQEKKKREYVSHALEVVLGRYGIVFQDIEKDNVMNFSMNDAELSISGTDMGYLSMEVVGQYEGETPTLNDKRKSTSSALHFCSILPDIERELKDEFGVVFKNVSTQPPSEAHISMKKNGSYNNKKFHENKKCMSI